MIFVIDLGIMQLYPIHEFAFKNGCQYADGGFGDLKPILCAIENGACEIDVIILEEENRARNNLINKNQFSLHFSERSGARKRQTTTNGIESPVGMYP
jgi:predicted patatin/cPLA2 family phospholipase